MGSKGILITIQTFTENTITVCADNDDKIQRLFLCLFSKSEADILGEKGRQKNKTKKHPKARRTRETRH